MKKIAIIPLRKNSKGIPGKNKMKMVGRPLFTWVLTEAVFSELDEVYVFTDDEEIINFVKAEYQWTTKVKALLRDKENATDFASTESAMIEFSKKINHDFDILCLLQATSPYTTSEDINNGLNLILKEEFDSVVSVVNTHRFIWDKKGNSLNYDIYKRPRRQDFEGLLVENGAIYCTTKSAFQKTNNRISGNVGVLKMPEESLVEIDSPSDWEILENILISRQKKLKKQDRINYLVLDVDGVFTDGCVYYGPDGELMKKFDMRDGMGLEILRQYGVDIVVITSENSKLVERRMNKLKIENVFMGVKDKYSLLKNFIQSKNTNFENLAYIGDDVNDLSCICTVGWSFAPNNATQIVKKYADVVLSKKSASGAIREACEFILKYNKRYE